MHTLILKEVEEAISKLSQADQITARNALENIKATRWHQDRARIEQSERVGTTPAIYLRVESAWKIRYMLHKLKDGSEICLVYHIERA